MSKPWKIALGAIVLGAVAFMVCGIYLILRYKTYSAPSGSMEPTIHTRQIFVADRFAYHNAEPRRGDVVLLMPPVQSDAPYIKRVVAVPGDRFAIRGGRTFVNGTRVVEPFAPKGTPYDLAVRGYDIIVDGERLKHDFAVIPPRGQWTASDAVPRGCYIVLGDNRMNSEDSHAFGFFCPGHAVPNRGDVHPELIGRAIVR